MTGKLGKDMQQMDQDEDGWMDGSPAQASEPWVN